MFNVTVKRQGSTIETVTVMADNDLAAIRKVEERYPSRTIGITNKRSIVPRYQWTGYEFEVRKL